jgi:hypothetical protein
MHFMSNHRAPPTHVLRQRPRQVHARYIRGEVLTTIGRLILVKPSAAAKARSGTNQRTPTLLHHPPEGRSTISSRPATASKQSRPNSDPRVAVDDPEKELHRPTSHPPRRARLERDAFVRSANRTLTRIHHPPSSGPTVPSHRSHDRRPEVYPAVPLDMFDAARVVAGKHDLHNTDSGACDECSYDAMTSISR